MLLEYITMDEFSQQSFQIQSVFKQLFTDTFGIYEDDDGTIQYGYLTPDRIGLLTESQLRIFIEFRADSPILKIEFDNGYNFELANHKRYNTLEQDLFKAYWQVAIKVAQDYLDKQFENYINIKQNKQ